LVFLHDIANSVVRYSTAAFAGKSLEIERPSVCGLEFSPVPQKLLKESLGLRGLPRVQIELVA
jgi:hypothetical protein